VDPIYELDKYFPPRYLAFAIPAVLGILFVCATATLIGVIMIISAKETMQKEKNDSEEYSENQLN